MQLSEEELKTKAITIERQSQELEDRANHERKQDKEMQVHMHTTDTTTGAYKYHKHYYKIWQNIQFGQYYYL